MVKKIIFLWIVISLIFQFGCAPKYVKQTPLPELKFQRTLSYEINLSNIIKPDKPVHMWVDSNFKEVPISEAKYLLLTNQEYAKYVAQLRIKKTYKEVINQQAILINQYIDVINSLKEYVALERMKADEYRKMWVDSENAYRYEKHLHDIDNVLAKGAFGFITIGALVAAILIAL